MAAVCLACASEPGDASVSVEDKAAACKSSGGDVLLKNGNRRNGEAADPSLSVAVKSPWPDRTARLCVLRSQRLAEIAALACDQMRVKYGPEPEIEMSLYGPDLRELPLDNTLEAVCSNSNDSGCVVTDGLLRLHLLPYKVLWEQYWNGEGAAQRSCDLHQQQQQRVEGDAADKPPQGPTGFPDAPSAASTTTLNPAAYPSGGGGAGASVKPGSGGQTPGGASGDTITQLPGAAAAAAPALAGPLEEPDWLPLYWHLWMSDPEHTAGMPAPPPDGCPPVSFVHEAETPLSVSLNVFAGWMGIPPLGQVQAAQPKPQQQSQPQPREGAQPPERTTGALPALLPAGSGPDARSVGASQAPGLQPEPPKATESPPEADPHRTQPPQPQTIRGQAAPQSKPHSGSQSAQQAKHQTQQPAEAPPQSGCGSWCRHMEWLRGGGTRMLRLLAAATSSSVASSNASDGGSGGGSSSSSSTATSGGTSSGSSGGERGARGSGSGSSSGSGSVDSSGKLAGSLRSGEPGGAQSTSAGGFSSRRSSGSGAHGESASFHFASPGKDSTVAEAAQAAGGEGHGDHAACCGLQLLWLNRQVSCDASPAELGMCDQSVVALLNMCDKPECAACLMTRGSLYGDVALIDRALAAGGLGPVDDAQRPPAAAQAKDVAVGDGGGGGSSAIVKASGQSCSGAAKPGSRPPMLMPLGMAAANGYEEALELLLQRRVDDPNVCDKFGLPALWFAVEHAQPGCVRLLLQAGARAADWVFATSAVTPAAGAQGGAAAAAVADRAAAERASASASAAAAARLPLAVASYMGLCHAVEVGDVRTVRELLRFGACPYTPDDSNGTPYHMAIERGDVEIVQALLDGDPAFEELQRAQADIYRRLLHASQRVERSEVAGCPCVQCNYRVAIRAAASPETEELRAQLQLVALPAVMDAAPPEAAVPLMAAMRARGALLDAHDADGYTALHLAVRAGNLAAMRWLLQNGADPLERDALGYMPLHLLAHYGCSAAPAPAAVPAAAAAAGTVTVTTGAAGGAGLGPKATAGAGGAGAGGEGAADAAAAGASGGQLELAAARLLVEDARMPLGAKTTCFAYEADVQAEEKKLRAGVISGAAASARGTRRGGAAATAAAKKRSRDPMLTVPLYGGHTAAQLALRYGRPLLLAYLLHRGAPMDLSSATSRHCLEKALEAGHSAAARILLSYVQQGKQSTAPSASGAASGNAQESKRVMSRGPKRGVGSGASGTGAGDDSGKCTPRDRSSSPPGGTAGAAEAISGPSAVSGAMAPVLADPPALLKPLMHMRVGVAQPDGPMGHLVSVELQPMHAESDAWVIAGPGGAGVAAAVAVAAKPVVTAVGAETSENGTALLLERRKARRTGAGFVMGGAMGAAKYGGGGAAVACTCGVGAAAGGDGHGSKAACPQVQIQASTSNPLPSAPPKSGAPPTCTATGAAAAVPPPPPATPPPPTPAQATGAPAPTPAPAPAPPADAQRPAAAAVASGKPAAADGPAPPPATVHAAAIATVAAPGSAAGTAGTAGTAAVKAAAAPGGGEDRKADDSTGGGSADDGANDCGDEAAGSKSSRSARRRAARREARKAAAAAATTGSAAAPSAAAVTSVPASSAATAAVTLEPRAPAVAFAGMKTPRDAQQVVAALPPPPPSPPTRALESASGSLAPAAPAESRVEKVAAPASNALAPAAAAPAAEADRGEAGHASKQQQQQVLAVAATAPQAHVSPRDSKAVAAQHPRMAWAAAATASPAAAAAAASAAPAAGPKHGSNAADAYADAAGPRSSLEAEAVEEDMYGQADGEAQDNDDGGQWKLVTGHRNRRGLGQLGHGPPAAAAAATEPAAHPTGPAPQPPAAAAAGPAAAPAPSAVVAALAAAAGPASAPALGRPAARQQGGGGGSNTGSRHSSPPRTAGEAASNAGVPPPASAAGPAAVQACSASPAVAVAGGGNSPPAGAAGQRAPAVKRVSTSTSAGTAAADGCGYIEVPRSLLYGKRGPTGQSPTTPAAPAPSGTAATTAAWATEPLPPVPLLPLTGSSTAMPAPTTPQACARPASVPAVPAASHGYAATATATAAAVPAPSAAALAAQSVAAGGPGGGGSGSGGGGGAAQSFAAAVRGEAGPGHPHHPAVVAAPAQHLAATTLGRAVSISASAPTPTGQNAAVGGSAPSSAAVTPRAQPAPAPAATAAAASTSGASAAAVLARGRSNKASAKAAAASSAATPAAALTGEAAGRASGANSNAGSGAKAGAVGAAAMAASAIVPQPPHSASKLNPQAHEFVPVRAAFTGGNSALSTGRAAAFTAPAASGAAVHLNVPSVQVGPGVAARAAAGGPRPSGDGTAAGGHGLGGRPASTSSAQPGPALGAASRTPAGKAPPGGAAAAVGGGLLSPSPITGPRPGGPQPQLRSYQQPQNSPAPGGGLDGGHMSYGVCGGGGGPSAAAPPLGASLPAHLQHLQAAAQPGLPPPVSPVAQVMSWQAVQPIQVLSSPIRRLPDLPDLYRAMVSPYCSYMAHSPRPTSSAGAAAAVAAAAASAAVSAAAVAAAATAAAVAEAQAAAAAAAGGQPPPPQQQQSQSQREEAAAAIGSSHDSSGLSSPERQRQSSYNPLAAPLPQLSMLPHGLFCGEQLIRPTCTRLWGLDPLQQLRATQTSLDATIAAAFGVPGYLTATQPLADSSGAAASAAATTRSYGAHDGSHGLYGVGVVGGFMGPAGVDAEGDAGLGPADGRDRLSSGGGAGGGFGSGIVRALHSIFAEEDVEEERRLQREREQRGPPVSRETGAAAPPAGPQVPPSAAATAPAPAASAASGNAAAVGPPILNPQDARSRGPSPQPHPHQQIQVQHPNQQPMPQQTQQTQLQPQHHHHHQHHQNKEGPSGRQLHRQQQQYPQHHREGPFPPLRNGPGSGMLYDMLSYNSDWRNAVVSLFTCARTHSAPAAAQPAVAAAALWWTAVRQAPEPQSNGDDAPSGPAGLGTPGNSNGSGRLPRPPGFEHLSPHVGPRSSGGGSWPHKNQAHTHRKGSEGGVSGGGSGGGAGGKAGQQQQHSQGLLVMTQRVQVVGPMDADSVITACLQGRLAPNTEVCGTLAGLVGPPPLELFEPLSALISAVQSGGGCYMLVEGW